jgi:hypothetical protein
MQCGSLVVREEKKVDSLIPSRSQNRLTEWQEKWHRAAVLRRFLKNPPNRGIKNRRVHQARLPCILSVLRLHSVRFSWTKSFWKNITSNVPCNVGRGFRMLIKKTNYIACLETARWIY